MDHQYQNLRRGAWTEQEDNLLRLCIETNGEGNWPQVPHKAGLNRCRKSCRLRWVNYLKPTIKRGEFADDEVDLILKLHKLLGNRWSLIAGRLPGRTANDVKNYWNSHLSKKENYNYHCSKKKSKSKLLTKVNVIKPRPWSFKSRNYLRCRLETNSSNSIPPPSSPVLENANEMPWWENLLPEKEGTMIGFQNHCAPNFYEETSIIEDGSSSWADLILDLEFPNEI